MDDCHIHVDHAGLRFRVYSTRHRSIKETVLNSILRRNYGRPSSVVTAIDDVSLTVKSGERLGVVGDNGAGKSSLLKLMARIYPPTRGRVSS